MTYFLVSRVIESVKRIKTLFIGYLCECVYGPRSFDPVLTNARTQIVMLFPVQLQGVPQTYLHRFALADSPACLYCVALWRMIQSTLFSGVPSGSISGTVLRSSLVSLWNRSKSRTSCVVQIKGGPGDRHRKCPEEPFWIWSITSRRVLLKRQRQATAREVLNRGDRRRRRTWSYRRYLATLATFANRGISWHPGQGSWWYCIALTWIWSLRENLLIPKNCSLKIRLITLGRYRHKKNNCNFRAHWVYSTF